MEKPAPRKRVEPPTYKRYGTLYLTGNQISDYRDVRFDGADLSTVSSIRLDDDVVE